MSFPIIMNGDGLNLTGTYELFSREATRLMNELKNSGENESALQKELAIVQSIISAIFRLKALKKKASDKL